jgi:transcription-repair coupling factor (superfamily II helicase)
MQGKAPKNIIETKMVFPIDARIPEEYIPDITLRMEIYQRIGEAYSFEAIEKIEKEIIDRFGAYPEPFRWLYHLSRAKIFAAANKFLSIEYKRKSLTVEKRTNGVLDKRKTQFVLHNDPKIFEEQLIEVLRLWR